MHVLGYLSHDQGGTVVRKFSKRGLCVSAGIFGFVQGGLTL